MLAALLTEIPATALRLERGESPTIRRPDDVLLAIEACGICGTDLHILDGTSYRPALPFVLGHEPVGVVIEVGSAIDPAMVGRRMTMTLFEGCGSCGVCRSGAERLCGRMRSIVGVSEAWGGFAELLLVRHAQLVEVPVTLSTLAVATLVDAGATAMNAVRTLGEPEDELVVIVGAGPVGFLVASIAQALGHNVQLAESTTSRRRAATEAGFRCVEMLREISSDDIGAVVDCAPSAEALPWATEILAPRGKFVAAGYGAVPDFDTTLVARKELSICGVRSGSGADLARALALAANGEIQMPEIETWTLDDINAAFTALREGRVAGKAVIEVTSKQSMKEGAAWTT